MPKVAIARIEQKLDDLINSNTEQHTAILGRLDKLNGSVGDTCEDVAVLKDKAVGQDKVNWSIFVVLGMAVVLAVLSSIIGKWL